MSVTKFPSPPCDPVAVPLDDLIGVMNSVVQALREQEEFDVRRDYASHPRIVEARVLASKALEALYEAYAANQRK